VWVKQRRCDGEVSNTYGVQGKDYKILVQISEGGRSSGSPSHKERIILKYIVIE
jgi:hypothetical protein